jgi:hypothetical protein
MTSKTFQNLALLALMPFLLTSCFIACSLFDNNETVYYGVEGEGYVVYAHNNNPVPYAHVGVMSNFRSYPGWGGKEPIREWVNADTNGYFRVRFLKCVDGSDIAESYVLVSTSTDYSVLWGNEVLETHMKKHLKISKELLQKDKEIIRIDTAKLYADSIYFRYN